MLSLAKYLLGIKSLIFAVESLRYLIAVVNCVGLLYILDIIFFADGAVPTTLPSPGSSIRDGAQRILQLSQKSEWPPLDPALKVVEKLVAAGGDDVTSTPLAGVVDQVI